LTEKQERVSLHHRRILGVYCTLGRNSESAEMVYLW
jgi:hypothetical protein